MNRKRLRKLQASFAKRGGLFWSSPDAPPEITAAFLQQLLECPECREAVLEATNAYLADGSDVNQTLRELTRRRDH